LATGHIPSAPARPQKPPAAREGRQIAEDRQIFVDGGLRVKWRPSHEMAVSAGGRVRSRVQRGFIGQGRVHGPPALARVIPWPRISACDQLPPDFIQNTQ
jgi:hypothetical protein